MLDGRYNPFKDAGTYNSKEEYEYWQNNVRALYVPVEIRLLDRNGTPAYYYANVWGTRIVSGNWWETGDEAAGSSGISMGCVVPFLNTGDATQGWDGGWKDCCTPSSQVQITMSGNVEYRMVVTKAGAMYMSLPPDLFGHTLEIKIKSGINSRLFCLHGMKNYGIIFI